MFSFLLSQRPLLLSCTLCCLSIIAQANDNSPIDLEGEYYAFGAVVDTVQPHASRASAAGMARMSVQWAATPNGRFALTLDHRHGFTNPPPGHWLPQSTGIMSLTGAPFSDQGWRLTHGYWEQTGLSDRWHAMVGYLDSTDFIDLYPYGSPYSGFSNVQFSTGSGTIVLPDEASIGGMIHHQMGAHYYLQLNVSDARADSSHPWQRAEAVFRERRTFEAVELGWVAEPSQALAHQLHVTGWRSEGALEQPQSQEGLSASWNGTLGAWTPFLRGGVAQGSQVLYSSSLVAGTGYQGIGPGIMGMALGQATSNRDGHSIHNAEFFYRLPLGPLTLTPNLQYVEETSARAGVHHAWVMGLRARLGAT
ncbi:carbohydrate porin (plasmid) [Vibrio coralliilyticus OCN008]|uniref:carbohydrate porin n=1 Tax=Vibrio coralliilyticus TaxID=190893 RepID=UPI0013F454DB|nr:carbohydrate porin [Vibrio coralliilyticus]QIJ87758.1 carbohydrate porin [Vibrio coralliilyticus OCN008]